MAREITKEEKAALIAGAGIASIGIPILVEALKPKPPPAPTPAGALKIELIYPEGYEGSPEEVVPEGTILRVSCTVRAGVPEPDLRIEIQKYDPTLMVYYTYRYVDYLAVPKDTTKSISEALMYDDSGRYRGYARLINPIGTWEDATAHVDVTIGEAPAGEVTITLG